MVKESEKTSDSSPEVPAYYVWGLDLSQSMQGAGGVGGLIASVKSGNEDLYSFDANGNVGQMVKSSDGSIAARYEYDPFGKTIFSEGPMAAENPYRFSTKYQDDETGLYYYGFRYYDAEMGRWINRDPAGEGGGINLYQFTMNNSIGRFDNLGLLTPMTEAEMRNYYLKRAPSEKLHLLNGIAGVLNLPFWALFGDKGTPDADFKGRFCFKNKYFEIVFMNGIMNEKDNVAKSAITLQNLLIKKHEVQTAKVGYVHNKTGLFSLDGDLFWGIPQGVNGIIGVPYDLIQVALEQYGMEDSTASFFAEHVNTQMNADQKLHMILFAHSQGGAKLKQAYDNIQAKYSGRIKIITAAGAQINGFDGANVTRLNKEGDLVGTIGNNGLIAHFNYSIAGGDGDSVTIPEDETWRKLPVVGLINHGFISHYADDAALYIKKYMDEVAK